MVKLTESNPEKVCACCGETFSFNSLRHELNYRIGTRDWNKRVLCYDCGLVRRNRVLYGAHEATEHRKSDDTKTCKFCGAEFNRTNESPTAWASRQFCSSRCAYEPRKGKPVAALVEFVADNGGHGSRWMKRTAYKKCRICGATFHHASKYVLSCDNPDCRAKSEQLRRENLSRKTTEMWRTGVLNTENSSWNFVARISKGETVIKDAMAEIGFVHQFKYTVNTPDFIRTYHLDFAIPDMKLYVEIDGSSHKLPKSKKRDAIRTQLLHDDGWQCLRFWEREAVKKSDSLTLKVKEWVDSIKLLRS